MHVNSNSNITFSRLLKPNRDVINVSHGESDLSYLMQPHFAMSFS